MADVTGLHKVVRKANGLQDFQRAGLNASGTGVMRRPVVLIDNSAGNAMPIKLSGHEQARPPRADHQYLAVRSHQISSCSRQLCRSNANETIVLELSSIFVAHAVCETSKDTAPSNQITARSGPG